MPTHPNAIGYIRDFGHSEGISWLEMICDLAATGSTSLDPTDLEILVQLFTKKVSYLRQPAPPVANALTGAVTAAIERLEVIGPFNGFKRLGDSLVASFPKRVTIIFGSNGSGKSSLCEALQILASNDAPRRPLHDVRVTTTTSPSFAYKFASDVTAQSWSPPAAYGACSTTLKYFDTGIAFHNIRNSVQPGRIIELSPFKLEVFETAINHCETLRTELHRRQSENATHLTSALVQIRTKFKPFDGTVLAGLDKPQITTLDAEIELADNYSAESGLEEKLTAKTDLEKATSEEGLKLLKGEVAALKALLGEIQPILSASEKLIEIDPVEQATILKAKENELELLAKSLIPSGATLEKLMALIRPANEVCSLHSLEIAECPLCKQSLQESELELFKLYAELLTGELDIAITELRKLIKTSEKNFKVISDTSPDDWAKGSVLTSETIETIKNFGKAVQLRFKAGEEIDQDGKDAALSIRKFSDNLSSCLEEKETLIENAGKDREELLKQLEQLSTECKGLLYAKEIADNIELLTDARKWTEIAAFWVATLPDFKSVLRKVTSTAKKAHKELVVEDFKTRLNEEYLALAEKDMSAFGVELKDVGGDGAVTVDHHVAGQRIESVLSEGELRIHALALFFAELETCEQQVIVFDDPISSFDYNYIGNYCNRLRDLIQAHSNRQIIVLTHNWEFFVQMQMTLNTSRLNQQMSVHVLESCVALDEYSENVDDLKTDIEAILAIAGEPTKPQKEVMAGKMRRLIEAVVNTHVFNKQRHQFKQKNQQVSAFDDFTKVVALLTAEAQSLRDLFAKLSIAEHDDPRNAYVNTDKAMFQTRYNKIKAIETAIIGRK
ncbi:AAA family ATPase [Chlorobium ferrooxidans]|uniref:SMC protein-like n=1 Tax=Chlorobium ferrooxidans DSM 13031 TaxID=377431 RepID=Q0YV13_9CHLB|nr:AAA family ATPase [Chlorobium ferrooxidans]EAT59881.1 SMC protein-like [Chlorobium ferrooxidans DSM 13031]